MIGRRRLSAALAIGQSGYPRNNNELVQVSVPVGVASAMRRSDVLVPSYRENAALLWRGVGIHEVLSYYAGSERGSDWAGPPHDFPTSITVGGHALHAAGAAFAMQYRGEDRAVACVFGDAATSKGDVYEAFNLAGVCACRWCSWTPTRSYGACPMSQDWLKAPATQSPTRGTTSSSVPSPDGRSPSSERRDT